MMLPKIVDLGNRCCGCCSCRARCPMDAVQMRSDGAGFLYPFVDRERCINCELCERACPVIAQKPTDKVSDAFWAIAKNEEILVRSSSGGVFGLLARKTLGEEGIVYGAAFSEAFDRVMHVRVEDNSELDAVMRSKYVQGEVSAEIYHRVKEDLEAKRSVLYSGTACQIAALKGYLGKQGDTPELLCVDVICHGVPSPELWKRWLAHQERGARSEISEVNFRDKVTGWQSYSLSYVFKSGEKASRVFSSEWYMEAFLANASLRPSCFECPSKRACGSDITLGDYWGASDDSLGLESAKGVSAVLCNTEKGAEAFGGILPFVNSGKASLNSILDGNPVLFDSVKPYARYNDFMDDVFSGATAAVLKRKWRFGPSLMEKVRWRLGQLRGSNQ